MIREIDEMGGVVAGIHKGYFRRAIAEASYRVGQEMEAGDRIIVGVNAYPEGNEERTMEILQIPHTVETVQCDRLSAFRKVETQMLFVVALTKFAVSPDQMKTRCLRSSLLHTDDARLAKWSMRWRTCLVDTRADRSGDACGWSVRFAKSIKRHQR